MLLPISDAQHLQIEALRTWQVCLSYGLANHVFRYVYCSLLLFVFLLEFAPIVHRMILFCPVNLFSATIVQHTYVRIHPTLFYNVPDKSGGGKLSSSSSSSSSFLRGVPVFVFKHPVVPHLIWSWTLQRSIPSSHMRADAVFWHLFLRLPP